MNIVVLGAGVMGTAFTTPAADAGHKVYLVGTHLDNDIIEEIQETRFHPKLKRQVHELVVPVPISGLEEVIKDVDLVVLGVNSLGVQWAAHTLADVLPPNTPVVMLTKGLHGEAEVLSTLPAYFTSQLPPHLQDIEVMAIGGPCIAGELHARQHSCVVLGGHSQNTLTRLANALRTSYYHVWTTTDLIGLEVSVAMKNLYALAVGVAYGLLEREGLSSQPGVHNPAAAVFAQGLYETAYLVNYLGGKVSSVFSLPGAGDLYVTCQGGRNSRMGRLIGLGMTYTEAREQFMPNESVEGAMLAEAIGPTVRTLVSLNKLDARRIPLLLHMIDVICDEAPVEIPWDAFFTLEGSYGTAGH